MNKENIQNLKDVLKILDQCKFDGISMRDQLKNVEILNKFSAAIVEIEKESEGVFKANEDTIIEKPGIIDGKS